MATANIGDHISYFLNSDRCSCTDCTGLDPPLNFNIYSTYIVVQCRLYTPAKYVVSNSKNMPLLQIPTTQFSTTIRQLN